VNASLLPLAFKVLLVVTALIAGGYDLRYRRIPNRLTLAAAALGLILNTLFFHWHGLGSAFSAVPVARDGRGRRETDDGHRRHCRAF